MIIRILPTIALSLLCLSLWQSTPERVELPQSTTILFVGDVMQHTPQLNSARTTDGYDYTNSLANLSHLTSQANLSIANLETTLTTEHFTGYPRFRSPWQLARDLKRSGITHLVLANNHCCDNDRIGIIKTTSCLDTLGIAHTGIYVDTTQYRLPPLMINTKGFKIALLNYTYGTNGIAVPPGMAVNMLYDTLKIEHDIKQAQALGATNIITFLHWGEEYETRPNHKQRSLARWLHNKGADIVIGSHPHVVQRMEYVVTQGDTTGITAYSLGNLVSNQQQRNTTAGIAILLTLRREFGQTSYRMSYTNLYVATAQGHKIVPEFMVDSLPAKLRERATLAYMANDSIIGAPHLKNQ